MIDYLKKKLKDEDLLNAPKILRTHVYVQEPFIYDIKCLICDSIKITWSEYEDHVWCYDCNRDVLLVSPHTGIFNGPIPIDFCKLIGVSFKRINLKTKEVIDFEGQDKNKLKIYNETWVKNQELIKYNKNIRDRIK